MKINFKQAEIVAALKQYVSQQGINLEGKDVTIDFTAGRGQTGISADISIENAPAQAIAVAAIDKAKAPAMPAVKDGPAAPAAADKPADKPLDADAVPAQAAEGVKAGTSLFA